MIFGNDRAGIRGMYAAAWRKRESGEALSPLEAQIARIVAEHPEYIALLRDAIERDYSVERGETNPFLHMGLHLGIRDQVATDRPAGIRRVYEKLAASSGNGHAAEHRMIDCLAEVLWEAQRKNQPPDEVSYLERLRRLAG